MTHSMRAAELVAKFEGFSATAYADGNNIATIGYGHTAGVKLHDVTTEAVALVWLSQDLDAADQCLNSHLKDVPMNQNQFDALCSFVFNIGCGNFSKSTCFRNLEAGQYAAAGAAMLMWNKIAGKVSAGLVRRREAELELFSEAV